jgi:hypothetical protein
MVEKGKTLWGIKPPPASATSVELPVASSTSRVVYLEASILLKRAQTSTVAKTINLVYHYL